jgi:hypothetical protein
VTVKPAFRYFSVLSCNQEINHNRHDKREGAKKETERGISVIECARVASSADHLQMRRRAGNNGVQE